MARDAADKVQLLLDARMAYQRESDRMQAAFEGPSAVAWHEYATAVQDAAQAVVRGEATVAQFIEREGLRARQLRETNEEIAARKTPMQQLLADLAFEQKLMAMGNAERATAIQLRGMEADEIKKYGAAVLEANRKLLEAQKAASGQDFFRDSVQNLWNDAATGAKSATDAVDEFFDRLRVRAIEALGERLIEKLFGQRGSTDGGAAGSTWASWLGDLFGGAFAGGGRPPVGKASLVGERGPELFVPDYSGTIIPADQTEGILAGAGRGMSIGGDTIIIQGATSKRSLERVRVEKQRRMARAVREFSKRRLRLGFERRLPTQGMEGSRGG